MIWTWYTCKHCPPHGMADHSMYGDRHCLVDGCPCKGYEADKEKPVPKRVKSTQKIEPFSR